MKFSYNPRIIQQLGTELITSDEIALSELIKNAYDARADKVNLHFLDRVKDLVPKNMLTPIPDKVFEFLAKIDNIQNLLILEDDGHGMNSITLQNGFFEVGTTIKKELKRLATEEVDEDILLGDKGIGRLSAQRLSPILIIETTSDDPEEDHINIVQIEWSKFIKDKNAESIDSFVPKGGNKSYTRLWFVGNTTTPIVFENFFQEKTLAQYDIFGNPDGNPATQLHAKDELQSVLSFLYSPFETKKSVLEINISYNGQRVPIDFHSDTLLVAESIHYFELKREDDNELYLDVGMKIRPWLLERIHLSQLGKSLYQDWRKEHTYYSHLFNKYQERFSNTLREKISISSLAEKLKGDKASFIKSISSIAPISGKVYSFKRDGQLLRMAIDSALSNNILSEDTTITDIRPFLSVHNGIKLYRNKFRIATLGDKDNDWLKLAQKRTSGQQFSRFELGNVTGFVKINDLKQNYIYETSSREHIKDNIHSKSLLKLLDFVFNTLFYQYNKNASEIIKDILLEEGLIPTNTPKEIKQQVDSTAVLIEKARENLKAFQKAFSVLSENKELDTPDKIESIKRVLDEIGVYSEEFSNNLSESLMATKTVKKIIDIAEQEKKRIEVEAYNNYKLMANGLITEVITHELHSLLTGNIKSGEFPLHFKTLKGTLFEDKRYMIHKEHLTPIKKRFDHLHLKMDDLNRFYQFLEKTFIYKGTTDDFELADVAQFITDLNSRFDFRLNKYKITLDYSSIDIQWYIPRGSLVHVLYNLIDNSIYWIRERQKRSLYDRSFYRAENDKISIVKIDENTIHYSDSGTGVLEKYQYTLFHPLISGRKNGRGMGLYIIRKFLESFDAKIQLLPNLNDHGNRFVFEISLKPQMEEL